MRKFKLKKTIGKVSKGKRKLSPNDDIKLREKLLKQENKINDLEMDLEKDKRNLNKLLK
jgi:hypothetical protein